MTASDTLTIEQLIGWAEDHARLLYDGTEVAHRSCGIALAETFGRPTAPYQSLRRGGITGHGQCGAIKAGELILGEIFGDPDPTGAVTETLRRAMVRYRALWQTEIEMGRATSIVCNDLTGQFDAFRSPERHAFCTDLAATTARCIAQTVLEMGSDVVPVEPPER